MGVMAEHDRTSIQTNRAYRFILPRERELVSTFALDQLTGLSGHLSEHHFWAWIVTVFGVDISREAAIALREALRDGNFPNPEIQLLDEGDVGGGTASYNREERIIKVSNQLLDQVLEGDGSMQSDEAALKLMVALVEEFGHHVDVMLRFEYSSVEPGDTLEDGSTFRDDADLDEGAAFAHAAILLDIDRATESRYATVQTGDEETPLLASYQELHDAVRRYADEEAIQSDDQSGDDEHFSAGEPRTPQGQSEGHCFTHLQIEREAFAALPPHLAFDEAALTRVYYGNWLRDYSQLIDPKLVHHAEHNPMGLKRETLTEIVDLLARSSDGFGDHADFIVTPEKLGVYLPKEHIDNPDGYEEASQINPAFRGVVRASELDVDASGVKRFIEQSRRYVADQLREARVFGRNPKGMMHFGNALHVLEDFYSHSNFAEIALRKVGFSNVDPWVPTGGGRPVLTTGSFGGLDTAATILLKVGEILEATDPFAIVRSRGQQILLILMRDKTPNLARHYAWVLDNMEEFKRDHEWFYKMLHETVGQLKRWFKFILGLMLRSLAKQIDDAQTAADPSGTDPTHTQIAKDDRDHHFHELASRLAIGAVSEVALAMTRDWAGESGETPLAERESELRPVESGDTLVSIAADYGMTWRQLAQYNWGSDNSREINRNLYQVVGCRAPNAPDDPVDELANYRFSDDDHQYGTGALKVPKDSVGSVDVVDVALGLMRHPEDLDWMDGLIRDWGNANPAMVRRGESRSWLHDHAEEIRNAGDQWTDGVPVPRPMLDWLEWLGKVIGE